MQKAILPNRFLILGLEGSRPESYTLWVFKEQNAIELLGRPEFGAEDDSDSGRAPQVRLRQTD